MYLETERLILRDFSISDFDDLYKIFGDDEVMKNCAPTYNKTETENLLSDFCISRSGAFALVSKKDRKVIGYVLFNSIEEPEIFEIGWFINKNYWRKGYTFEISSRLISYGFEEMKLHKISAETTDEVKSIPLMKKLGMKLEGIQRKHSKSIDGSWCDLYWYAILENDYFGNKL